MDNILKYARYVFNTFWILITLLPICYLWVFNIVLSGGTQENLLSINIGISTILFGVLGVWISIVYGEALSSLVKGTDLDREISLKNIGYLIYPMLWCVLSIIVCTAMIFGRYLFRHLLIELNLYSASLKSSASILILLTSIELFYIIALFKPILKVAIELRTKNVKSAMEKGLFKNSRKS